MYICCFGCGKTFFRDTKHVNENLKLKCHNYCSLKCLGGNKRNRILLTCDNPSCSNKFERTLSGVSKRNYCCLSCSASVNNKIRPKRKGVVKQCLVCGAEFKGNKKFCSVKCKFEGQKIDGKVLLNYIKEFYSKNKRIPLKREMKHYRSTRSHFGTWNSAIKQAGFDPNPVMFANKHKALDGHFCDSFAEKIIDDWFFERKIDHKRSVPYPSDDKFTCDFLVGNYWIEFFGLSGELKRYDQLKQQKIRLAKKLSLRLVEIYPEDLLPMSNLKNKLNFLNGY